MNTAARILVVDDEAGIRFFLEEALARDGHEVVAVDSGEMALQRLASDRFDVALIDLKMKEVGGIEVLTYLRQQSPNTAAIVLTAHGSLETAVAALRQGAHDYLFKPCKTADLRASVRAALTERQREQRQQEVLAELETTLAQQLHQLRATLSPAQIAADPAPTSSSAGRADLRKQDGLGVDRLRHTITLDDQPLNLSPTEFGVVAYLAAAAPRVVTAQELIREVQGYACELHEAQELARYHVHRIRQKARCLAGDREIILTVRGVGYRLGMPVSGS